MDKEDDKAQTQAIAYAILKLAEAIIMLANAIAADSDDVQPLTDLTGKPITL